MSAPILPPGIKVSAVLATDERLAVRIDLATRHIVSGAELAAVVVLPPRQARALGALLLRQADLIETPELGDGA